MKLECARNCRFQPPLHYEVPRKYFKNYTTEWTPSFRTTDIPPPSVTFYCVSPVILKAHMVSAAQTLYFLLLQPALFTVLPYGCSN